MIGFQESLHCAADEEVLFGGDGPAVCVCVCVRWRECEGCESLGPPSVAWPGLVLVPPLLSNHSEDQRPGTCEGLEIQRGHGSRERGVRV